MHGNVVHALERECSIQRRFQKIIEESPSPGLTPDERVRICEAAAGITRAAGYHNAGTVEFIYGAGQFYFLEMNTRLRVEHPVTEEVTGLDLVAEQFRIAGGAPLGYGQEAIRANGHAIELRLYAEDAARGFTPTTGEILAYRVPPDVRVDSGIGQGSRVTAAFDPMLAKVIVHGTNRSETIAKASQALADFVLLGCRTNTAFLRRLLADPDFVAGHLHTGLIADKPELAQDPPMDERTTARLLAAAALSLRPVRDAADAVPALHAALCGWRN
jgi:propionyl-CoA carboxylase alpha chain/3-methylcrotonyl-CoA carboxylase alpha subunit/acetyl-CoA/propionyl-CoA carboxylase biotin carboxyl carrier protein